jgi:outer membrane protein assembly factor BamB
MTLSVSELWRYRFTGGRNVDARTPCITDELLLCVFFSWKGSGYESALIAFSLVDGSEQWRYVEDHLLNSPKAGHDGMIYISSYAGAVICLDRKGSVVWRTALRQCNMGDVLVMADRRIAVAEIAGQSKFLYSLNADNGHVAWTFDGGGHAYRLADAGHAIIYCAAQNGPKFDVNYGVTLFSVDSSNGRQRWQVHSLEWMFTPLVAADSIIVGARGSVRAYQVETGKLQARHDIGDDETVYKLLLSGDHWLFQVDETQCIICLKFTTERKLFKTNHVFTSVANIKADAGPFIDIPSKGTLVKIGGKLSSISGSLGEVHNVKGKARLEEHATLVGSRIAAAKGRDMACYRVD